MENFNLIEFYIGKTGGLTFKNILNRKYNNKYFKFFNVIYKTKNYFI